MSIHKNQEGAYTIQFFDKYGRSIKSLDRLAETLQESKELGEEGLGEEGTEAASFLIKRNVYNSVDHK